jgi:hypothetical protein
VPSTRQFSASPVNKTLWLPSLRLSRTTLPPGATKLAVPASTVTLKPSLSGSEPLVLTATSIRPSEDTLMRVSSQPAANARTASGTRGWRRVDTENLRMLKHLAAPWRFP